MNALPQCMSACWQLLSETCFERMWLSQLAAILRRSSAPCLLLPLAGKGAGEAGAAGHVQRADDTAGKGGPGQLTSTQSA